MRTFVVVLLVACGGAKTPEPEPMPVEPEPVTDCAAMAPEACYTSAACVIDAAGACIAPTTPCESAFVQSDPSTCASPCTLVAEPCFCPPGVVCVCGGGAPPRCAEPTPAPE